MKENMMYNNKVAAAIKVNGKVLREHKDTVYIPFGEEYTILFKNLNSVRAQFRVSIDGTEMTGETWMVVKPNSEFELERSIVGNNFDQGNRFKFIERTEAIESGPRGIQVADGLVRIEYQFEVPQVQYYTSQYLGYGHRPGVLRSAGVSGSMGNASYDRAISKGASSSIATDNAVYSATAACDMGITVAGSVSSQQFQSVKSFTVEPTIHVMVIRLAGETTTGIQVVEPVTVKAKPTCTTCGHVNKALSNFCSTCGTSLIVF